MGRIAPDVANYLRGAGRVYFQEENTSGLHDFGSLTKVELQPNITTEKHFNRRSGTKLLDQTFVTEAGASFNITTEEACADNVRIAFSGDGVYDSSQAAGYVSGTAITVALDKAVEIGKMNLSSVKISHGTVENGPYVAGKTVTLGAASGTVGWVGSGFVEVYNITGTFASTGTLTCGSKTAAVTAAIVQQDVIVTDHATVPTKRYVAGDDYRLDSELGLLTAYTSGDIETTAYVSCDCALTTIETVRGLTNTSLTGKLIAIIDPDDGPHYRLTIHKAKLTASGPMGLIGDAIAEISLTAEILDDSANHPTSPFFDMERIA